MLLRPKTFRKYQETALTLDHMTKDDVITNDIILNYVITNDIIMMSYLPRGAETAEFYSTLEHGLEPQGEWEWDFGCGIGMEFAP